MWLNLAIKHQYRFDGIKDTRLFFEHVSLLLTPTDTLVLGCYEAREDIRRFLMVEALPTTRIRYQLQDSFDCNRTSYPRGAAFHLTPDPRTLEQLICFARSLGHPTELCDHVAAYSTEWPLFIFHDAFLTGSLYVSSRVVRTRVEAFSQMITLPFEEIAFEYSTQPNT